MTSDNAWKRSHPHALDENRLQKAVKYRFTLTVNRLAAKLNKYV